MAARGKQANRQAAKQRAAKRVAKKRAVKRVVKKRVAKRVAKKRVAKAARPVRRRAPKAAPPAAFAPQKAGATAKDLLLFEIERARVAVLAAIQGVGGGTAMQPVGEGKWSIHEIVLHLSARDRIRLDEFDSMLAGNPGSWAGIEDPAEQAAENEADLAPLRGMTWDDAVRLLMTTRAELLERLQAVPAEPGDVWTTSHPFGAILRRLWEHDRHHADSIKNARIAG
jgi:uncharacterized damage-inducible protein DinB